MFYLYKNIIFRTTLRDINLYVIAVMSVFGEDNVSMCGACVHLYACMRRSYIIAYNYYMCAIYINRAPGTSKPSTESK